MTTILHASTEFCHHRWSGPKKYVRIVIHDTHEQFLKGAEDYRPDAVTPPDPPVACFHPPVIVEHYDKRLKRWVRRSSLHFAGTIRMSQDWLTDEIIVHEVTHAAIEIYRRDYAKRPDLGLHCGKNEENLAYLIGELSNHVINAVKNSGIF